MEAYNFSVEHRPGRSHSNVDAMSRIPCSGTIEDWNISGDEGTNDDGDDETMMSGRVTV